ncbi:MAG: hypothetical protein BRD49_02420 [Bacteroidetes bacterium SW_10_40_5]|nr:MAG: hypothetical protein BRD49_02420 [Bacteroidetes bacterium SW_10_40_5]
MQSYANLANLHTDQQRNEKALALVDSIETLVQQYPDPSMKISAQLHRAEGFVLQGKTAEASNILDSLASMKPQLKQYNELQFFNETRLKWAAQKGDLTTAKNAFNHFVERKDSLHRAQIQQKLSELKVLHEVDKKNALIDKQNKIIAIKSTRNTWLTVALIVVVTLLVSLIIFYYKNKQLWTAVTNLNLSSNLSLNRSEKPEQKETSSYQAIFRNIEYLLKDREWYKDPQLNLKMMAKELGTNEYYVSRAINEESGMNFNSYINNYRVNMAKTMLLDASVQDETIAEIAVAVGFNNATSFSRTFKQLTGLSPTNFITLHQEEHV